MFDFFFFFFAFGSASTFALKCPLHCPIDGENVFGSHHDIFHSFGKYQVPLQWYSHSKPVNELHSTTCDMPLVISDNGWLEFSKAVTSQFTIGKTPKVNIWSRAANSSAMIAGLSQ